MLISSIGPPYQITNLIIPLCRLISSFGLQVITIKFQLNQISLKARNNYLYLQIKSNVNCMKQPRLFRKLIDCTREGKECKLSKIKRDRLQLLFKITIEDTNK